MPNDISQCAPPPSDKVRLRVHRVKEGSTQVLRVGSAEVRGILTHHYKENGHYCAGDRVCPIAMHNLPSIWKGYLPAHLLMADAKSWHPVILEVSENLELDFRHVLAVGQVWECFRREKLGKKIFPAEGKLLDERDPLPNAKNPDILGPLRTFYHAPALQLGHKNPMPERVLCDILESASALFKMPSNEPARPTPEEIAKMKDARKRLKGMLGGK